MSDKDYYKILGIEGDAIPSEIKKAFKKKALECHPDKNNGNDSEFKLVSEAYETLSDPERKDQYDNRNTNPFSNINLGGHGGGHGGGHNDIFEQMMRNMGLNVNMNNSNVNRIVRRSDHQHNIKITLRDAHTGMSKNLKITIVKNCMNCQGTCSNCNGTGNIIQRIVNGPMIQQIQRTCDTCNGSGISKSPKSGCSYCDGKYEVIEEKILTINIPICVNSGHQIKFEKLGEQPKKSGEISGDLIINIIVDDQDPYFKRENDNLIFKCKLNLLESYIGKIIIVPHFDESIMINTNIFGVINYEKRYHLKGKGIGNKGDLIFVFQYEYKDVQLTDNQRDKLQNCFKELNLM